MSSGNSRACARAVKNLLEVTGASGKRRILRLTPGKKRNIKRKVRKVASAC